MSRLPLKKNWGRSAESTSLELIRALDEMYTDIVNDLSNVTRKYSVNGTSAPANSQINGLFDIGDIWVRTDTNQAWILTSRTTPEIVNWQIIT